MLTLVWSVSIYLALSSIVIMVMLIGRRLFLERLERRRAAQVKVLRSAMIRFGADEDAEELKRQLRELPLIVVADAGFEFLALVRGEERARIERVLSEIGIDDVLRRQLWAGNRSTRIYSAERLAAFASPKTEQALIKALGDRSRQVRIAAAISLGELQRLPPLREVLRKIGYRGQRSRRMIDVFRAAGAERAGELREVAVDRNTYPLLRASAISAIGQTGDYGQIGFLQECAMDRNGDIAAAAINALGDLAHPSSEPAILAGLDNPDWRVRSEAARAAGSIGLRNAAGKLSALMEDEQWTVRYWAASSLKNIGREGVEMLQAIAEGVSSRSQRTASMVLAENG